MSSTQENGQRRFGGPPPGWEGPPPERGSEIFVGKLPRDLFEDELVPLCEKVSRTGATHTQTHEGRFCLLYGISLT